MKKIIFPLLVNSFLFSGFDVIAQNWTNGGNALAAPGIFGATTVQPIVFYSSGTERGRLHANGNWAFGTLGGVDKVQINTPAGGNAFRAAVGGVTKLLVHSGGGVSIGSGSTPPAGGLYVAGNIGIATATPAFALDVRGSSAFGQFKASSRSAGVILDKPAANQNEYLMHRTAGADRWSEGTLGSDNFSLHNWTNGGDALTVDISNNNVGIGATAADAKLNVVGSTTAGSGINVSGYANGLIASAAKISGNGVSGYSDQGTGVFGSSNQIGVYGYAPNGYYGTFGNGAHVGAYGYGNDYGVYGIGNYCGVYAAGVVGIYVLSTTDGGDGVQSSVLGSGNYGVNTYSANSYGLHASTGNSSSYAGYFVGNTYCTGLYQGSDAKLKKNIVSVDDAMVIINRLQPKNYEYRNDGNFSKMNLPKGQHYGFIAQDLEKVLPNLIKETSFDVAKTIQPAVAPAIAPPANGIPARPQPVQPIKEIKGEKIDFKAVNYIELIPIMVKGMQEQDVKMKQQDVNMKQQEVEIATLKSEINELKALILKNANGSTAAALTGYLKQNSPNPPLSGNTVIKYFAPGDARSAQILVTDMKGSILKTYKVTNGEGQLTIRTGELPSGTYNYTLYVNNSKIDTKQMIIAR